MNTNTLDFIQFSPLTESDISQLYKWFQVPHVKKWFARDKNYSIDMLKAKYGPRLNHTENIFCYIVAINKVPIGFIQYYHVDSFLPDGIQDYQHPLFKHYPASDIAGVDLFIADTNYLHKGYGSKVLYAFIAQFIHNRFSAVVTDPLKINLKAKHFFIRNNFHLLAEDGDHLLLILELDLINSTKIIKKNRHSK